MLPPYALIQDKTNAQSIRFIARQQLSYALQRLQHSPPRNKDVYEARKTFKRLRALLRLVRTHLLPETYARENVTFRDAGQRLAPLRDSIVTVETLDKARDGFPSSAINAYQDARQLLMVHHEEQARIFWAGDGVAQVIDSLDHAFRRAQVWRLQEDEWQMFQQNLARGWSWGNRFMLYAQTTPTPEILHEWRKQVKLFWYYLQFMNPIAPEELSPMIAEWDTLGDVLGKAHDYAVLEETLRTLGNPTLHEALSPTLLAQQEEKEHLALEMGQRLYAMKPKPFFKQLAVRYVAFRQIV